MKVFAGGMVFDCSEQPIGIVLEGKDRENLANMHPDATVYCEFVATGKATQGGVVEYEPASIERLLDLVKRADRTGHVKWWDIGRLVGRRSRRR